METLVANLGSARRVRNGQGTWLVAPMTLIVPGVLDGSKGPLYYPPNEIARNYKDWDGYPITRNHPTTNKGEPASAFDNGILDKVGMGVVRNPRIVDNKLVADGWFHESRTKAVDKAIWNALESGKQLELSTGLGTVNEDTAGTCPVSNRTYNAIARDYMPDHVAVLTDGQLGACSISDGCGVNNSKRAVNAVADWLFRTSTIEIVTNGFCPTGEGGGQDNSCGGEGDQELGASGWHRAIKDAKKAAHAAGNITGGYRADGDYVDEAHKVASKAVSFSRMAHTSSVEASGSKDGHRRAASAHEYAAGWHDKAAAKHDGEGQAAHKTAAEKHRVAAATHSKRSKEGRVSNAANDDALDDTQLPYSDEDTMNRDQAITHLTTNCNCWKGKKDVLANTVTFTDNQVIELATNHKNAVLLANSLRDISEAVGAPKTLTINELPEFIKEKVEEKDEDKEKLDGEDVAMNEETCPECEGKGADCTCEKKQPAVPAMNRRRSKSTQQWLAEAPPEAREMLTNMMNDNKRVKGELIDKLVSNAKGGNATVLRKAYGRNTIAELQAMLGTSKVSNRQQTSSDPLTLYFGAGGGVESDHDVVDNSANNEGVEFAGAWPATA